MLVDGYGMDYHAAGEMLGIAAGTVRVRAAWGVVQGGPSRYNVLVWTDTAATVCVQAKDPAQRQN